MSSISKRASLLCATVLTSAMGISSVAHAQSWVDLSDGFSQSSAPFQTLDSQAALVGKARQLRVDAGELTTLLSQAPDEQWGASDVVIDLPLPHGQTRRFAVQHSPILSLALSQRFPGIYTYRVVDVENPENTGRLDMTPAGFHAMLSFAGDTVFIDPVGTDGQYQSYFKSDFVAEASARDHAPFTCNAHAHEADQPSGKSAVPQTPLAERRGRFSSGPSLRTYRLAVAATGEFSQFHGGTTEGALAAIVTGINRVNEVYERDIAVKFQLVDNNSEAIFLDAATDPFTDDDAERLLEEVGAVLKDKIGVDNYDIGHVFSTGGGGIAGFGVVCGELKHEGVTGSDRPVNDPFFIDFVAHEIGHQFRADHTFNSVLDSCFGNRAESSAYEPGSGSTIMAYAALCGAEDLQPQADAYFHARSIEEMTNFMATATTGGSCGTVTDLNNRPPEVEAGEDGQIPRSTPFLLTGSATDADSDALTYVWEQYDLGPSTNGRADHVDDGSRPLFRSFAPTASPSRTFPKSSDVLNATSSFGEVLPTRDRDLTFRLTVRDGKGGVASDDRVLKVTRAAGPFTVTAPGTVSWEAGTSQSVSWDVSGTTAAPISCATVDIALSTDGGQSFGTVLAAATDNDGSASVTVPDSAVTSTGRLRVKCASQPFFAVNAGTITVTGAATPTPTPNNAPTAVADSYTVDQDSDARDLAVLINDTDPDGDTLTVGGVSDISTGGTVTAAGSAVSYRPAAGFSGTETFTYTADDGRGGTASAQVTVTVTAAPPPPPPNTAPVANDDSYTVDQDSGTTALAVLDNDTDAEGQTLSLASVSAPDNGGTATIDGTSISYQPATGFSGTETFTYVASDGTDDSSEATVTVTVDAPPPPPPPAPPPVVAPANASGGGGSLGLVMLLLLGAARRLRSLRLGRRRGAAA